MCEVWIKVFFHAINSNTNTNWYRCLLLTYLCSAMRDTSLDLGYLPIQKQVCKHTEMFPFTSFSTLLCSWWLLVYSIQFFCCAFVVSYSFRSVPLCLMSLTRNTIPIMNIINLNIQLKIYTSVQRNSSSHESIKNT